MEDSMAVSDNKNILAALEANWQAEMEGFHTYLLFPMVKPTLSPHCSTSFGYGGEAPCRIVVRKDLGAWWQSLSSLFVRGGRAALK
jgi:hypothetical protein